MHSALAMVTDARGYCLARYAMASALLTQTEPFTPYLFIDRWDGPAETDGLLRLAQRLGSPLQIIRLTQNTYQDKNFQVTKHLTRTAYQKFTAIQSLVGAHDRVLYADTDTIFYEPLPISQVDFRGNPIAAVFELSQTQEVGETGFSTTFTPVNASRYYFNSGVMLFDLTRGDIAHFRAEYDKYCQIHQSYCPYNEACKLVDQCAFNQAFENQWTPLPLTWNVQSITFQTDLWKQAALRHYTGPQKFLPLRARLADKRERAFLRVIANALGDGLPPVWPGMGVVYWINGLRRARVRSWITSGTSLVEADMRTLQAGTGTAL